EREVEWRDADAYADRIARGPAIHVAANAVHGFAHHQCGSAAGKFHALNAAVKRAARLLNGFAVLLDDQVHELLRVLLQQLAIFEENLAALDDRGLAPCGKRIVRRFHRRRDLFGRAARHFSHSFTRGGVVLNVLRATRDYGFSIDKKRAGFEIDSCGSGHGASNTSFSVILHRACRALKSFHRCANYCCANHVAMFACWSCLNSMQLSIELRLCWTARSAPGARCVAKNCFTSS